MITFICGFTSVLIYYILLLNGVLSFSRLTTNISYVMVLVIIISFFIAMITIIFGLFKVEKGIKGIKDRFLNKVGIIYGICAIITWSFLFFSCLWNLFMNLADTTTSLGYIKFFNITMIILSLVPIILGIAFLIKFIKIYKRYPNGIVEFKNVKENEKI